jgi:hypothetical protein
VGHHYENEIHFGMYTPAAAAIWYLFKYIPISGIERVIVIYMVRKHSKAAVLV